MTNYINEYITDYTKLSYEPVSVLTTKDILLIL
jgi:hypothetical protein